MKHENSKIFRDCLLSFLVGIVIQTAIVLILFSIALYYRHCLAAVDSIEWLALIFLVLIAPLFEALLMLIVLYLARKIFKNDLLYVLISLSVISIAVFIGHQNLGKILAIPVFIVFSYMAISWMKKYNFYQVWFLSTILHSTCNGFNIFASIYIFKLMNQIVC